MHLCRKLYFTSAHTPTLIVSSIKFKQCTSTVNSRSKFHFPSKWECSSENLELGLETNVFALRCSPISKIIHFHCSSNLKTFHLILSKFIKT